LTEVDGTLYGTTSSGGDTSDRCGYPNCGTVFSITLNGKERVLHSFSKPDGAQPQAGLIDVDGALNGTTYEGGTYGYGTVFALKP
jgi:uncharacterized repeat protein (TIGR03803 family)